MNTYRLLAVSLGLTAFAACNEPRGVTEPGGAPGGIGPTAAASHEALALRIARALQNPVFRAYVRAQLGASPFPERKLQLQEFLQAHDARGLRALGAANGLSASMVQEEAARAVPLEFYMPVPEHRAAWSGDERILVATALADGDAPVAFDPAGRRHQLRADRPPETPVLAVVPVETNFRRDAMACPDCDAGSGDPPPPPPPPPAGLYLTASHLEQDFEGWLKGSPEIEFHVLGQKGSSDTLMSYQCAGAAQGAPYAFDQDGLDWSGSVLLFSKSQLDAYNAAHPNKNVRIFAVEDDDGPCDIRTDRNRLQDLLRAVDNAYKAVTAGNDSSVGPGRVFKRAGALQRVFTALASWIKSNDDPIGNAVEDAVVGIYPPGYNWHLKGENNVTTGRIRLETR